MDKFIIHCILFAIFASNSTLAKKPFKLSMLALTPSKADVDGRSCTAAMQVAVEAVNSQTGILPDYEISVVYKEEGSQSSLSPQTVLDFVDGHQDNLAPTIVGPFSYCQKSSNLISHFSMVQFSYGCTAATFTANRASFPNLYRATIPVEDSSLSGTYFAKYVAKWKEVAMLTYSGNSNEYPSNAKVYWQTIAAGMQFVMFTSELDVDVKVVQAFKDSGARIIVVSTAYIPFIAKFLCISYDLGMRGSRYVFYVPSLAFFSLDAVPYFGIFGCTRQKMAEQFKRIFWTGIFFSAVENTGNSSLGYDAATFDAKLNSLMNNTRPLDYPLRHACHDSMAQALLVLDESERRLKAGYDMSLRDFRDHPTEVLQIVNSTAATLEFIGLRAGRMAYSKRLEMDQEPTWTAQAPDGFPRMLYKVALNGSRYNFNANQTTFNLKHYEVTRVNDPVWFTENGKPPKDLSEVVHDWNTYPKAAFLAGIIVASVLTTIQCVACALCFSEAQTDENRKDNLFVLTGGIFVNLAVIASLLFYRQTYSSGNGLLSACNLKFIFYVGGVSFIIGSLFARIILVMQRPKQRLSRMKRRPGNRQKVASPNQISPISSSSRLSPPGRLGAVYQPFADHGRFVASFTAIVVACRITILIIWLSGVDPLRIVQVHSDIAFSPDLDAYFDVTTLFCKSEYKMVWTGLLDGSAVILLAISAMFAYTIRKTAAKSGDMLNEYKTICVAIANATLVYICVISSLLIVDSTRLVTLHTTIFAFGSLLFSSSTSFIIIYRPAVGFIKTVCGMQ